MFDVDGELYLIGGSNGIDPARLRKRVGVELAARLIRVAPPSVSRKSAGNLPNSDDETSSDEEAAYAALLSKIARATAPPRGAAATK